METHTMNTNSPATPSGSNNGREHTKQMAVTSSGSNADAQRAFAFRKDGRMFMPYGKALNLEASQPVLHHLIISSSDLLIQ
jgi:hypothetical protein